MEKPQSSYEYFMNSNTKSMLKGSKRKKKERERANVNIQTICKNPDSIGHMQKDRGHTEIVHQSDKQNWFGC